MLRCGIQHIKCSGAGDFYLLFHQTFTRVPPWFSTEWRTVDFRLWKTAPSEPDGAEVVEGSGPRRESSGTQAVGRCLQTSQPVHLHSHFHFTSSEKSLNRKTFPLRSCEWAQVVGDVTKHFNDLTLRSAPFDEMGERKSRQEMVRRHSASLCLQK